MPGSGTASGEKIKLCKGADQSAVAGLRDEGVNEFPRRAVVTQHLIDALADMRLPSGPKVGFVAIVGKHVEEFPRAAVVAKRPAVSSRDCRRRGCRRGRRSR